MSARSWPVPRAEGEPLAFEIQLPDELELVDVRRLARSAPGAPASAGPLAEELERAAAPAGLVLIGALRLVDAPAAGRPVLATLTVAFTERVQGPPSGKDKVARKRSTSMESPGEGMQPVEIEVVQYQFGTPYGALVMAFSTPNHKQPGQDLHKLYERIVESAQLGEERLYAT